MQPFVIVAGFVAEVIAWRQIAARRFSVWTLVTAVAAAQGIAAALVRSPVASGTTTLLTATTVGIGLGLALYLSTRTFVTVASRWESFREQVLEGYRRAREVSLAVALALSLLVVVPGEELFWRGLVQPRLQASMPVLSGPALAWIGYVVANAASGSLPLVAAAAVGGAVWGALALWTHGVVASVACHATWTGLMLAYPPGAGREMMRR